MCYYLHLTQNTAQEYSKHKILPQTAYVWTEIVYSADKDHLLATNGVSRFHNWGLNRDPIRDSDSSKTCNIVFTADDWSVMDDVSCSGETAGAVCTGQCSPLGIFITYSQNIGSFTKNYFFFVLLCLK